MTTTEQHDVSNRDIAVGAHTLRLYETGTAPAPAVLWLHGAGPGVGAVTNWAPLITQLSTRFHNLAPDMLGFADSSHPDPPPLGMRAFTELRVETLLAMLDHEKHDRVHVVGNSMGAMVAIALALKAPERIGRIVLHGSPGAPNGTKPRAQQVVSFYDDPSLDALRALLRSFFAEPDKAAPQLEAMARERHVIALRPEVRRSHDATFHPAGGPLQFSPAELGSLPHEVLVVHGREDHLVPLAGSAYLAEQIPDAHLHVLPRAGHWVHVEQAARFAAVTSSFLDGWH